MQKKPDSSRSIPSPFALYFLWLRTARFLHGLFLSIVRNLLAINWASKLTLLASTNLFDQQANFPKQQLFNLVSSGYFICCLYLLRTWSQHFHGRNPSFSTFMLLMLMRTVCASKNISCYEVLGLKTKPKINKKNYVYEFESQSGALHNLIVWEDDCQGVGSSFNPM